MKTKLVGLGMLLLTAIACHQNTNTPPTAPAANLESEVLAVAEGFSLMESSCFTCHSPNASLESRIAPPMEAIKKHYIQENTSLETFTKALITFIHNPSVENSKMPGAVDRFGLMPKISFSEAEIRKMAQYIYHTELEKPDWFDKHYQEEKARHEAVATAQRSPLATGKEIALKTQGTLGSNLKAAINAQGTEYALAFCSTEAIPLTDSMGILQNAQVKRVSDKNRNPANKANSEELIYIKTAQAALMNGQPVEPKLIATEDGYIGYYPILTSGMCLQCHGKPKDDIAPATFTKIRELYPEDKAINYKADELRGIWVVEMAGKQASF